jgi:hypothetical protein
VILLLANQPEMYSASGEGVRWKSVSQAVGGRKGSQGKVFKERRQSYIEGTS